MKTLISMRNLRSIEYIFESCKVMSMLSFCEIALALMSHDSSVVSFNNMVTCHRGVIETTCRQRARTEKWFALLSGQLVFSMYLLERMTQSTFVYVKWLHLFPGLDREVQLKYSSLESRTLELNDSARIAGSSHAHYTEFPTFMNFWVLTLFVWPVLCMQWLLECMTSVDLLSCSPQPVGYSWVPRLRAHARGPCQSVMLFWPSTSSVSSLYNSYDYD